MDAITFDQVSKRFAIRHERSRTLQEAVLNFLLRRNGSTEAFWALRGVSFHAEQGQTLGIIGQNGSGKSTILKLITGTLRPTSGTVHTRGRAFGLLELGAGFHPDLTGRENIFLNGSFLGLSRGQMAGLFDSIVEFSELETFIDAPLKHYSSGMYMRLGFAVAVHVDPDILVIDEVLAVGDAAFRQKCFAALAEFKRQGKTILFVSHDAAAVRRFCDQVLWLEAGRVKEMGDPETVTRAYLSAVQSGRTRQVRHAPTAAPDGAAAPAAARRPPLSLGQVETINADGCLETHFYRSAPVAVRLSYHAQQPYDDVTFGVGLHRGDGTLLHTTTTRTAGGVSIPAGAGAAVCHLGVLPLAPGEYTVSAGVWVGTDWRGVGERRYRAARFALEPRHDPGTALLTLSPTWACLPGRANGRAVPPSLSSEGDIPVCWTPPPRRLVMGERDGEFLGHGWYPVEDWPPRVRWMGPRASLFLTQDDLSENIGIAIARPHHGPRPATGRVLVEGAEVGSFLLASPGLERFSYPVRPVATPCPVKVTIEVAEPLVPAELGISNDTRALGVAVREVWFE